MGGQYLPNNIYNVDSYKAIKEIPDKSIDCIYVDVPYLYHSGGNGNSLINERAAKKKLELMGAYDKYKDCESMRDALRLAKQDKSNDFISIEDGFNYDILDDFIRISRKVNIFIWCSKLQLPYIMNKFVVANDYNYDLLVWNKTNPLPLCHNTWLSDVEYCLYFREKNVILNDGYELKSKWFTSGGNVKDKEEYEHPTIKPLELVKRHLKHATQPNDIVLDCFLGSGTTAVACKELGRRYIGFEINKKYYDIALDRLKGISVSDRKRINNGQQSLFDLLEENDG